MSTEIKAVAEATAFFVRGNLTGAGRIYIKYRSGRKNSDLIQMIRKM